jgi:ribosome biogenesis GTPase / thiamine phosphate phosphatase
LKPEGGLDTPLSGEIVAAYGRHFLVNAANGSLYSCVMRGKRGGGACGDRVEIRTSASGQGVIETILPRSASLYRSDPYRQKLIAANITQMVIVVAAVPSFSEELVNRCLVAAENQRIPTVIALNKCDLVEPSRIAIASLALYGQLGYPVVQLSAKSDTSILLPYLQGHLSVLVGQSGMGKSTIVNGLIPAANRATREISTALDSGRHTTTHARLYTLDHDTRLIDSPGLQEFGLDHICSADLAWEFVEFRPYLGRCKFSNCCHTTEPGCAIGQAANEGRVDRRRLAFYQKLVLPLRTTA